MHAALHTTPCCNPIATCAPCSSTACCVCCDTCQCSVGYYINYKEVSSLDLETKEGEQQCWVKGREITTNHLRDALHFTQENEIGVCDCCLAPKTDTC